MSENGRNTILEGIRGSLGRSALSTTEVELIYSRTVAGHTAPQPQWEGNTWGRFIDKFEAAAGTIQMIGSAADIPGAVEDFIQEHELAPSLAIADHPDLHRPAMARLLGADPRRRNQTRAGCANGRLRRRRRNRHPRPGLRPKTPTLLNFLPEYCIVLLHAQDLFDYYEQLWARLATEEGFPQRVVNLITGPSRTADVEQTIQLGAHGPRELHVLLLNE